MYVFYGNTHKKTYNLSTKWNLSKNIIYKKFIDIYEKIKEGYSKHNNDSNINILKSYINVPFTYTNIELLLWINYYMKFDKNIFNIMTTNFLATESIMKEIYMEFRKKFLN